MEMVLEGIRSIPGVSSVFFFKPQAGVISQQTNSEFTKEGLLSISQTLEKFFSWGAELFSDIRQIRLKYEESALSAFQLNPNLFLIILHKSALDQNLFDKALSKILGSPATTTGAAASHPNAGALSQSKALRAAQPAARGFAGQPDGDPLAQILASLENSLNKVLGPIAAIIFSDTRQVWLDGVDSPNQASIERLIQMLCDEIGDTEKVKTFKSLAAPHLKS